MALDPFQDLGAVEISSDEEPGPCNSVPPGMDVFVEALNHFKQFFGSNWSLLHPHHFRERVT